MKEIMRPAYTILEELEQRIDDAMQPASMGNHMKNADRIKRSIHDMEAWLRSIKNEVFTKQMQKAGPFGNFD
jgi:hypothetical protein